MMYNLHVLNIAFVSRLLGGVAPPYDASFSYLLFLPTATGMPM